MRKGYFLFIIIIIIIINLSGCFEQKTNNVDTSTLPNPIETKLDIVAVYYLTGWGQDLKTKSCDWSIGTPFHSILGEYKSWDPDVADEHIKMAVEHGINNFIMPASMPVADYPTWASFFEQGLLKSKFLEFINFSIILNIGPWYYEDIGGVTMKNMTIQSIDYFTKNYFNHPQYLKVEGKPFLILYQAFVQHNIFGFESLNETVNDIRNTASENGYELYLVGDVMEYVREDWWMPEIEARIKLFDAITSYVILDAGYSSNFSERVLSPYSEMVEGYENISSFFYNLSKSLDVDFIPPVTVGFNNSYVYNIGKDDYYVERKNPSPELFGEMIKNTFQFIDFPKMIVIEAWNEYHEGTVLEPTIENGYSYLEQVKKILSLT
jgi:hypothetical protein